MLFQQFIDEKLGFGNYQTQLFIILCFAGINNGAGAILNTLLNPVLKQINHNYTSSILSIITSLLFIGIGVGSLCSGYLSDKYGRKLIITYGSLLHIWVGIMYYLTQEHFFMFFVRFADGFAFGFNSAVISTMFIEICSTKYRGKLIVFLCFAVSIGKMYGVLLGYLFMKDDLDHANWRVMMFCGNIPSFIVLLGCIFILNQSPRFLLVHQRFSQAFTILDKISISNDIDYLSMLTENNKKDIQKQFSNKDENLSSSNYLSLFQSQYLKKTIVILLVWFINNFCYYAQITIEAMHISTVSSHINLDNYLITIIGEMPCIFISLFLVDNVNFGRKRSIVFFNLLGSICHLLFFYTKMPFFGSFATFFMKNIFQIVDALTTESYPTRIRMQGYNFCSGLGRMGAILMPYVVIPLDQWRKFSASILMSALMMLGGLTVQSTLSETMYNKLD